MPILSVKNIQTYYELHGNGEQTIVLLSGLMGDHAAWTPMLRQLSENHQVLIFDNRGVGRADTYNMPYTVADMADDTMQLISKLDINTPHIVGHSLGGAIAQEIARHYPTHIASVTLANTFTKLNARSCEIFQKVLALFENNEKPSTIFQSFIHEVFSKSLLSQSDIINTILTIIDSNPYPQNFSGYKSQLDALINFNSLPWLESIKVPTLIIHADEDRIVTHDDASLLLQHLPQAEYQSIAGGHATHVEKPNALTKLIVDFASAHCAVPT